MKLKNLFINKFRGATQPVKLEFDPSKKITMIFGENGNGKSSIADALISLCTDTIGSIRDKSSTDRSFIKSLGCSPNDVNIKLSTDSGTYSAQLNASGSTFIKTPNISFPTVRHLRRSHIIHLIDAEPSKRYEVLKDYIDVSSIIKSEDELRKAKKSADDAFYKINITISSATKAIETSWNTEGRSGNSWEEWAKSESGKDITEQIEIQKRYNALVALWNDISVKRNEVIKTLKIYRNDVNLEKNAKEKMDSLSKSNPEKDFAILKVLTEAKDYISSKTLLNNCPVCEQGLLKDQILKSLADKINTMQEFQIAKTSWESLTKSKNQTYSTLTIQVKSLIDDLTIFIPKIKALLLPNDDLITLLDAIDKGASENDKYKALNNHFAEIDTKVGYYKIESEKIEKSNNQHNLIKQQYITLNTSKANHGSAELLAKNLSAALSIVETSRKDFIDNELISISDDIEILYQKLHPLESLGGIKLFLKQNAKNSIELNATFHSESDITPQSVYSESHLDTLGICIFLALAKKYNDQNTILILDDVVMSVDETHLDRFISLLHEEIDSFAHILITTHYRPWKDRYRFSRAPSHQVHFVELRNWSLEAGIKFQNGKIDIEELKRVIESDEFDRQRISNLAGIVLENVLDFLSIKFQCKVPRKPRNEYVLRELLDCLSSKLQKLLKVQHLGKGTEGVYDSTIILKELELKPYLDNLKQLSAIRNQVGAHYNFDGSSVSDKDVTEFANLVYEFTSCLICPENGNFPDRNKSGSYLENSLGSIRLYPLIEPA